MKKKVLSKELSRFKHENEKLKLLLDVYESLLDVQDNHILNQDKKIESFKLVLREYK